MWPRGWGERMTNLLRNTGIAARAADTLLRGTGGRSVMLRMPAPAAAGDINEQLGLAVPQFQDVELAPVILRPLRNAAGSKSATQLLVSASAVETLLGSLGFGVAEEMFAAAFGVLIDGVLLAIESVTAMQSDGSIYLYRLTLRTPMQAI